MDAAKPSQREIHRRMDQQRREYYGLIAAMDYRNNHTAFARGGRKRFEILVKQMRGQYEGEEARNIRRSFERAQKMSRPSMPFRISHVTASRTARGRALPTKRWMNNLRRKPKLPAHTEIESAPNFRN